MVYVQILGPCQELGTRPQTPVRGQRHFTIVDRKATFTGAWDGPHPDIMAQGGTFKMSRGKDGKRPASCSFLRL